MMRSLMPRRSGLPFERRSAVTVMFAMGAIPMVGLVGLAIDFGFWNQAHSEFQVAADAAAVYSVRLAAARYVANDSKWQSEAVQNGYDWFNAQIGTYATSGGGTAHFYNGAVTSNPTVTVTIPQPTNLTFTSTVNYTTATNTFIGKIFNQSQFGMAGMAQATITATIYSELVLLMDNSSSMEIGSTNADIKQIQALVPCDASEVNSGQAYSAYSCSGYDGGLACPITSNIPAPNTVYPDPSAGGKAPACTNLPKQSNGTYFTASAPCAFACHWDTSTQSQQNPLNANDYYGAVLRANANGAGISLRFNVLQNAVAAVLQTAEQQDIQNLSNISAGAYIFNSKAQAVYPTDGTEASTNLTAVASAVAGIPANAVDGAAGNTGNTDFATSMTNMLGTLTPAGDGSSATAPRKSLILVTDGMDDATGSGGRYLGPFATSYCSTLKAAPYNYTIYVLYTPYFPLMNGYYQSNVRQYVETTSTSATQSISAALQACASNATDYYQATNVTQIQTALAAILKSATRTSVRFTQ